MPRTHSEVESAILAIDARLDTIAREARSLRARAGRELTPGQREADDRYRVGTEKLLAEREALQDELRDIDRARVTELSRRPGHIEPGTPPLPGATSRRTETTMNDTTNLVTERDVAMRAIEGLERSRQLPDDAAARAEKLLSAGGTYEQSLAARWASTTGDPAYTRAFTALLADPERGHLMWTAQEADAYRRVAALASEMRLAAMTLTDANGGYMVPLHLDPAIILSGTGTTNAMRKVARVVQTTSESWQGVTSAGSTAEWIAESTQVAEAGPVLASVPIPVYKGDAFVSYSFEVGMDALGFAQELQRVLVDAADNLMATAYTVGSGSGQPTGVIQALIGGASEINTTGSEAIDGSDPYALQNALPPRFQARASFMANIAIINGYAQMETTAGMAKFPEIRDGRLLNRPLIENSDMDGAIVPSATANNYVLLYGDFSEYRIVDRIGTTLELIPNLMGANYRPTGQRGALLWFRTGGNVSTINAFRMLDVPTTA